MNQPLSRNEEIFKLAEEGQYATAIADELGVSRTTVTRTCEKHGVVLKSGHQIRHARDRNLRIMVQDMPANLAVDYLLSYIEMQTPSQNAETVGDYISKGLTGNEARIWASLSDGKLKSKMVLFEELYGNLPDAPDPKIIDVYICKIRLKQKNGKIPELTRQIETIWGFGYRMN